MKMPSAIAKVNRNGVLLVFPLNNKKEPKSLWSEFFPKTKMRWEWNDSGDNRVGQMWSLMKKLSDCRELVYTKWYQGRATFFSKALFSAMLCLMRHKIAETQDADLYAAAAMSESSYFDQGLDQSLNWSCGLTSTAKNILETLESDSPLSTRDLKKLCELQGKDNEALYARAMKSLFSRLLIVAFGEVADGAFPSLAVGATRLIFEDLWVAAHELSLPEAQDLVNQYMPVGSAFRHFFDKNLTSIYSISINE